MKNILNMQKEFHLSIQEDTSGKSTIKRKNYRSPLKHEHKKKKNNIQTPQPNLSHMFLVTVHLSQTCYHC